MKIKDYLDEATNTEKNIVKPEAPFEPDVKPKKQVIVGKRGAGMATAAHLARLGMKSVREWMELDELKKSTLASYIPKAAQAAAQSVYTGKEAQAWAGHHMRAGDYKASDAHLATSKKELGNSVKRLKGVELATKKLAKENFHPLVAKHFAIELYSEEELREMDQLQIDELKATTLQSYADKAHQQAMDATYDAAHLNRAGEEGLKASAKALAAKRAGGVQRAQSKLDKMGEAYESTGGAKHAYKLGHEHGLKGLKLKDPQQNFGAHAHHYEQGWADAQSNKIYHNEDAEEIYYDTMDLFLEALMSPEVRGRIAGHEKAGNKVSDQASRMKDGEMEYSFVVTQPSGKRSRHIYHGSKTKHETMSPAPKSKEAHETGEDDEEDK